MNLPAEFPPDHDGAAVFVAATEEGGTLKVLNSPIPGSQPPTTPLVVGVARSRSLYAAVIALVQRGGVQGQRVGQQQYCAPGRRTYADAGINFSRDGSFTTVEKNGAVIALMLGPFGHEALLDKLTSNLVAHGQTCAQTLQSTLAATLTLPDDHVFEFDINHQLGFVRAMGSRQMSAYIRPAMRDPDDPSQVRAEFRIFLDEPRAILFVEQGPNLVGHSLDLLRNAPQGDAQRYPAAAGYAELAAQIAATFNTAIETRQQRHQFQHQLEHPIQQQPRPIEDDGSDAGFASCDAPRM